MPNFLIDVNLPYYFNLWNTDDYVHQLDLGPKMPDKEIWEYAASHNLTIISKDSDFSNRILISEPPPKVIHLKIGNQKMADFHTTMNKIWDEVLKMSKTHKLVNVYVESIEGVK